VITIVVDLTAGAVVTAEGVAAMDGTAAEVAEVVAAVVDSTDPPSPEALEAPPAREASPELA